MKKALILFSGTICLLACTKDYYEGNERIVIEGNLIYNNLPLQNAEIRVYPVYNVSPTTNIISEINISNSNDYISDGYTISKTYTNNSGKISLSIPKNTNTDVYAIKVLSEYNSKHYGYISKNNTVNYYVNLGTLTF